MTCSPVARSYQALCRIPWWPGWRPVRIDVWFARVTVGSPAIAPYAYDGARRHQPSDVGRLAGGGERVEHVGVGAVEQEADDVPRPAPPSSTSVRTSPSWPASMVPSSRGSTPSSGADRGGDVDEAGDPRHQPSCGPPCPATTNGARACTTPSEPCSPR